MRILAVSALLLAACGQAASTGRTVVVPSGPEATRISTQGGDFDVQSSSETRVSMQVVPMSPDDAWRALPDLFREVGIRGEVLDAERRMFGTRSQEVSGRLAGVRLSSYFDCGGGAGGLPIANTYRVDFAVISVVRPVGARAELVTTLSAQATPQTVSGPPVRCRTTGALEARLAQLLAARAGAGE